MGQGPTRLAVFIRENLGDFFKEKEEFNFCFLGMEKFPAMELLQCRDQTKSWLDFLRKIL